MSEMLRSREGAPGTRAVMSTAGELLDAAARRLGACGATSARLEAQLLLGRATGLARTELLAHPEGAVLAAQEGAFLELLARREAAEPIAYLLGEREFGKP